jgi:hypothetical protein
VALLSLEGAVAVVLGGGGLPSLQIGEPDPLTLRTLTFLDFESLTSGPAYGRPHLSVTQSQVRLSQRIPFRSADRKGSMEGALPCPYAD